MKQNKISGLFDLTDKNIVITGSAGLLGSQYAYTLSEAGANVILIDVNERENTKLEKFLKQKFHTEAKSYTGDISKKSELVEMKRKILDDFKTVYGLVNNAAYTAKGSRKESVKYASPFEEFPFELWTKSIDINLTGVFLCCQEFGKIMLKQKKGVIVNISSIYGLVGADQRIYGESKLNTHISYASTKGAIVNLTRYLAAYWHGKNIRVNTLTPGGVIDESYQSKEFIKKYSEKTILGRMARSDEYNGALLFLMSDASSYMTGANLVIDGGWTAW
tara:strand:- start:17 stop:844 length:828 start_codon:yes stop_codon:yes gene_type:complete